MPASAKRGLSGALPGLRRTLHRFRHQVAAERKLILVGLLALFAEVALRLLEPWPLAYVIDAIVAATGADLATRGAPVPGIPGVAHLTVLLIICAAALVGVVALRAGAAYLMTVCFALAGNRVLTRVRTELYGHLNRLSLRFHESRRTGDLVTRVTGDIGRLQEATVTAAIPLAGNVITLAGMFVVIVIMDWQLALAVAVVFPLFLLIGGRLTRKINSVSRGQREAEGALASLATESLGAMPVVQSYALESRLEQRFGGSSERTLADGVRAKKLSAGLERKTDVLVGLATGVVLLLGGHRVLAGALTPGELTVFLTYLKTAFRPLRDIAKYTGRIAKAAASGERIVDLLDTRPEIVDAPWARPAPRFRGLIEFRDVVFGYRPGRPVLKGLNLIIPPGRRVALVGPSGAGKSSIAGLLSRLRDPDAGQVLIDGRDLRDLTLDSARSQVAVVLQDSVLFADTIRANIAFGAPDVYGDGRPVGEEWIRWAARLAGADQFIQALPQGYDTVIGERGATLSGGQRQRIAIARAAIRNAPIVILDEAMTGLDPGTEAEVAAALRRLTEGRTTLVITHDLDAARDADLVFWIDEGRVVRAGTPTAVFDHPTDPRALSLSKGRVR
ncbi:ABC transporter ATP-binding protein [Microlunatus parietis]|uniref:ATP-binding cassette subfamily B protein n=1 Tax=Microlunatus parietis TaxID=682979 RepID=A0A7Y9IF46_9ACTN|nr:ABC transporter ATP-binding protein [Microlunatus parietis]NYE75486.1 ATP-binding cassette subfamily B protein [Microlunatus parietis]